MERLALFSAATVPALLILTYGIVKFRGSWNSEPLWTAFFLGGVAVVGAVPVELVMQKFVDFAAFSPLMKAAFDAIFVAALPEESVKFIVLVGGAERHVDVRRRIDILTLALAVSLGFAFVENLFYVAAPGDWQTVAALRAISAVPGHGINGLIMGALVVMARMSSRTPRRVLALALVVPVVSHAAYDFPLFAIEYKAHFDLMSSASLVLVWLVVLLSSAVLALVLSNRALAWAIDADRAAGRDVTNCSVWVSFTTGLLLLIAGPAVAVVGFAAKDAHYFWFGAVLSIMPVVLGIDLVWMALRPVVRKSVVQ